MATIGSEDVPRPWADRALREIAGAEILLTRGIEAWLASDVHSRAVAARLRMRRAARARGVRAIRRLAALASRRARRRRSRAARRCTTCCSRADITVRERAPICSPTHARDSPPNARVSTSWRESIAGSWPAAQDALAADAPDADDYFGAFRRTWDECQSHVTSHDAVTWPNWPIQYVPIPEWTAEAAPYLYYLYYRSPAPLDPYSTYDYVVPRVPEEGDARVSAGVEQQRHPAESRRAPRRRSAITCRTGTRIIGRASRAGKIAAVDCASRIGMFCGGTMAEGWACYATQLVGELGFLTPLERLSEQHSRVRFLARAIVDIELHQRHDVVRRRGAALRRAKSGMSEAAARAEAVKNSMFPCTAIMYWLGTQGIVDLRETLRAKRGAGVLTQGVPRRAAWASGRFPCRSPAGS